MEALSDGVVLGRRRGRRTSIVGLGEVGTQGVSPSYNIYIYIYIPLYQIIFKERLISTCTNKK